MSLTLLTLVFAALAGTCAGVGITTPNAAGPLLTYNGPVTWDITGTAGGPFSNWTLDIELVNPGRHPVTWSASAVPGFLHLATLAGEIPPNTTAIVHAQLDTERAQTLGAGKNAGTLSFHNHAAPQADVDINCTLSIANRVSPTELIPQLDFLTTGPAGGPFLPPEATYWLTNTGSSSPIAWQADARVPWIVVTPASGTLSASSTTEVKIAIQGPATAALDTGSHSSLVAFVNTTNNTTLHSRTIALDVKPVMTDEGWTNFTPSSDTRRVYVSGSKGDDSNDGLSEAHPKRTISAGKALIRDHFPDWLLLKCGDTWDENLGEWEGLSGRSINERMLISSYGAGERPLLRTGTSCGARLLNHNSTSSYIAFVGLHFWANTYDGSNGAPDGIVWFDGSTGLLIEDCKIDAYEHGIVIQATPDPDPKRHQNVQLRRNVITDSYSTRGVYAQGVYLEGCDGLLIEENLLDRNGWNDSIAGSTPSWFLHNCYVHNNNTAVVIRGNIVAGTDGVQIRPGGIVEDNLFLRTAIAIEFGNGTVPNVDGVSGVVRNNVILDGGDIGTPPFGGSQGPRGWGLQIGNVTSATVEHNIIANNTNGHGARVFSLECANGYLGNTRGVENLIFQDNIVYNWGGSIEFHGTLAQTVNVQLRRNTMQNLATSHPLFVHMTAENIGGLRSSNNICFSSTSDSGWVRRGNSPMQFQAWRDVVHDEGSVGSLAQFPDPHRTIATYHASIGGAPSLESFLTEARRQSKHAWRVRYEATSVNKYIRQGFGL